MRSVTIVHVAEMAGVSVKTVSRVVNNEPNVSAELLPGSRRPSRTLGYSPNIAARRMGGAKSYLIVAFNDRALTLENWRSDRGNNWIDRMQYGAMLECDARGYHLLLELIDLESEQLERRVAAVLSTLRPDGVILTPPSSDHPDVLAVLARRQIPFVRMGSMADGPGHSVALDDAEAARVLTGHLLELGHRRIGFITGSARFAVSARREDGFVEALRAAGVSDPRAGVTPGDFTFEGGARAAEILLAQSPRPTAIIASNDEMALAVLHVAQRLGLSTPRDLSVATFDDSPSIRFSFPPMTTIRQPVAEMAALGARILIDAAATPGQADRSHHLLPFELIVRESTGPVQA
ncbi:LacI family transcriptional regulator [Caulobacter sp. B11]|uniref:LacI family DNA-binding transcriptional regulator n=1 Tax=Caulobacter sp. B11 TaxID=2048899 RepID=UPI000C12B5DA|nr:LacI family DNA-binding transcriptional regulator [Caulobacter sp. B11]PHY13260.1 LacI family transcriptional regulator [Caulobacter sp. B11]